MTIAFRALLTWCVWSANSGAGFTFGPAGPAGAATGTGASNGVASKLIQVPWMSGCPSGVRPGWEACGACADSVAAEKRTTSAAILICRSSLNLVEPFGQLDVGAPRIGDERDRRLQVRHIAHVGRLDPHRFQLL